MLWLMIIIILFSTVNFTTQSNERNFKLLQICGSWPALHSSKLRPKGMISCARDTKHEKCKKVQIANMLTNIETSRPPHTCSNK